MPILGDTFVLNINAAAPDVPITLPPDLRRLSLQGQVDRGDRSIFHSVRLRGARNIAFLGSNTRLAGLAIDIQGNDNTVIIGGECELKGSINIRGNGRIVFIGAHTTAKSVKINCKSGGDIYIGRDCMFSSGTEVRTSDSHAIIDLDTNTRINAAGGVYIGDHTWVGKGAVITKHAFVAPDTIIAMNAFVRGVFTESSTILAGSPAKVVRTKRSWAREELVDPAVTDIYAWRDLKLL